MNSENKYDFVIVGSGFGGSVAALRLREKGYSVAVLEKGRRFRKDDFAKTNWEVRKYLWAPKLGCRGIQEITLLKGVMALHGAGVGGGSLVYANTLMRPDPQVLQAREWGQDSEWAQSMDAHYKNAEHMLGVTENKIIGPADRALEKLGEQLQVSETFHRTRVGVFFGEPGQQGKEVQDPYFGGEGPWRVACTGCGGCMVGCRVGAKNTLDQNYLYFAEKKGASVFPNTEVEKIEPLGQNQYRYCIHTCRGKFFAKNVLVAAGTLGTLKLLFRNRDRHRSLPKISQRLGKNVRTNGESLCGATSFDSKVNYSEGVAIGSAIHPSEGIKIEPVRYSEGSDLLRFMAVPLTGAGNGLVRPLKMIWQMIVKLPRFLRLLMMRDWARSSVILLVMQTVDQKLNLTYGRCGLHFFFPSLKLDRGSQKVPSYMPIAQESSEKLAKIIHGEAENIFSEVLLGIPATAHILGGVSVGDSAETGVMNHRHEVHGYPGLYVCDGSVISVNLGVNPSLTIAAVTESWASQFPTI
jgi:cholesterol oxidase